MRLLLITLLLFQLNVLAQEITLPSLDSPPATLSLFGEGTISTFLNERDFAISPDGNEIYYTVSIPRSVFQTIVYCKRVKGNKWTQPEVVSFAGKFSDLEPAFSSDGNTLYFASNRPLEGSEPKDFDIWKVARIATGWGTPVNLGSTINTTQDEFYPSVSKSGNLYFTATYNEGIGREDIYVARYSNESYQKPTVLDTAINTKFYEFNAFVSAEEDYMLFTSYGRSDDAGGGDLYMSVKDKNGKWKQAINLKEINSKQLDYCPYVSPDSKILFVTSERHQLPSAFFKDRASYKRVKEINSIALNSTGNIYWIDFEKLHLSILTNK
jgi:Tol biopolymer transport system component